MTDYNDGYLYDDTNLGSDWIVANIDFGQGVDEVEDTESSGSTPQVPTEGQLWPRGNQSNNS
ncbi:hypothetical protein KC946_01900 [Candidatus Saccharibacteria bacterium]|nr:hypothetical protein [Candidatus Saccharibacteria bacterium]